MTVGGRVGALWIGGLEPYMDETFLQVTFVPLTFTGKINRKPKKNYRNVFSGECSCNLESKNLLTADCH